MSYSLEYNFSIIMGCNTFYIAESLLSGEHWLECGQVARWNQAFWRNYDSLQLCTFFEVEVLLKDTCISIWAYFYGRSVVHCWNKIVSFLNLIKTYWYRTNNTVQIFWNRTIPQSLSQIYTFACIIYRSGRDMFELG